MKILINTLSLNELVTNYDPRLFDEILTHFAHSLKIINVSHSPNNILLTGDYNSIIDVSFGRGNTFRNQMHICKDSDARGLVLARLSNYEKIDNLDEPMPYCISFFINDCWKEIVTPFQQYSPHTNNIKNIPCLNSGALTKKIDRASILLDIKLPQSHDIINFLYAELYYNDAFAEEFTALMRTSSDDKNDVISRLSKLICTLNGFVKDVNKSKMNGRDIFFNRYKCVYFSVDYLHGTFEVYNDKGAHQYEINFKGIKIEDRDKKGMHDIRIK
jgi:hypothetical protein